MVKMSKQNIDHSAKEVLTLSVMFLLSQWYVKLYFLHSKNNYILIEKNNNFPIINIETHKVHSCDNFPIL